MNAVSIHICNMNRSTKAECKFDEMSVTTRKHSAEASTLFGAVNEALTKDGLTEIMLYWSRQYECKYGKSEFN